LARSTSRTFSSEEASVGIQHLSKEDLKIVRECLVAAVEGPFFPEWEFPTLFGLERADVAKVMQSWPNVSGDDKTVTVAVSNTIGNLVGYPHGEDLTRYVSATPEQLLEILTRWRMSKGSSEQ
jgi:hypothetical protein